MLMKVVPCLCIVSYLVLAISARRVPDGYILDVKPVCARNRPTINILTDLEVRGIAKCANGDQNFRKVDAAHYTLTGSYSRFSPGCLFSNVGGVHKVEVRIVYGERQSGVLTQHQIFTISCTFGAKSKQRAKALLVYDGLIQPKEIVINTGTKVMSRFVSLFLQDVKNRNIIGSVPADKSVSLYAKTEGIYGRYQLRVISCFAVGAKNKKRYSIMKAGCGDGMVFPKFKGFVTKGSETRSPYFKAFHVNGDPLISFDCSFSLCLGCDGSSCTIGPNFRG